MRSGSRCVYTRPMRTVTLQGPNGPFRCTPRQAATVYAAFPEVGSVSMSAEPAPVSSSALPPAEISVDPEPAEPGDPDADSVDDDKE